MRFVLPIFAMFIGLSACSETPVQEQGAGAVAGIEKQIEADAKSLEEAADKAVKVLQSEISKELKEEGVGAPQVEERAAQEPED